MRLLIVAQVIPQWYIDLLQSAVGENSRIDLISGSPVQNVKRYPSPIYSAESLKARLFSWIRHYLYVTKWLRFMKGEKYDAVLAVSNPPINSIILLKLKRVFQVPVIYMNWDIYPQIIECSMKGVLAQLVSRLWHKLNKRVYPQIDDIITLGSTMAEEIRQDGADKLRVTVIPISVDTNRLKPIMKKDNAFCIENSIVETTNILISGKLNYSNNIELVLATIDHLAHVKDLRFIFIGEGPKYQLIEDHRKKKNLQSIVLLPWQDESIFPFSMASGDISIVSQDPNISNLYFPSKTFSMISAGNAIIGICNIGDDLYKLIYDNHMGKCLTNDDPKALAGIIEELHRDNFELQKMRKNARSIAVEKFSRDVVVMQYRALFDRYK